MYIFPSEVEPREWKEPADYVLEHIRPDDAVRVHPSWTNDPLPHLESIGDQILPQSHPVAGDIQDIRRIWIVTERDRIGEAIARLPYEPSRPRIEKFGDVAVVQTRVPSSIRAPYEFRDHLESAKVERIDGKSTRQCDNWNEKDRRWDCGKRDRWLYVGEHAATLGEDFQRCIWAHPLPDGKKLRVTFPEVPLDRRLRIRGGLIFRALHKKDRAPVQMRIRIDGETRYTHTFGPRASTWAPHDIPTAGLDGPADVTVEISSPNIKDRWFCFNGWAR
ncbi:MAG: hypothetical protein ABEN55_16715 [Bradymonadaceae bacterium]